MCRRSYRRQLCRASPTSSRRRERKNHHADMGVTDGPRGPVPELASQLGEYAVGLGARLAPSLLTAERTACRFAPGACRALAPTWGAVLGLSALGILSDPSVGRAKTVGDSAASGVSPKGFDCGLLWTCQATQNLPDKRTTGTFVNGFDQSLTEMAADSS